MVTNIYDQHRAAFANVSAYVICRKGERVATIAFKYPRDGAGRLYAYVHVHGVPMVRGFAAGGGYDKHSAACADAARRIGLKALEPELVQYASDRNAIVEALMHDDGFHWDRHLRDAGFDVFQAV